MPQKLHFESRDYNFHDKINNTILVSNVKIIVINTFTTQYNSRLIEVEHSSKVHRIKELGLLTKAFLAIKK